MKVLIISDYNAPYGGNFIESLKQLNILCTETNNSLYYLFPQRTNNKKWINELKKLSNNSVYFFKDDSFIGCYKMMRKIVKDNKVDILYCHFCRHKIQVSLKLFSILNHKKLVSHFHNHCKSSNNMIKNMIIKFAYWFYKGNLNIGCSKSVMKSMPYNKKICSYVDNGIDFKRLDNYKNISLKNSNNERIILMFGFDYYRKGIDVAIKAIKKLNRKDIILAISLASNQDKVEKNIIDEFGEIPPFIKFLNPINDIATYYKTSDIFLSAAREEGFCYSLVEAAYCGTKIISSNIDGVPKEIPGEVLFECGNSDDLASKINMMISNKVDKNAKEYVINNYGIDKWSKKIMENIKILFDED